jgi:WD40 repeat protein
VYSGGLDRTVRVWSAIDGTHIRTLEGHTSGVRALAVAADGVVYSASHYPEHCVRCGQEPMAAVWAHWGVPWVELVWHSLSQRTALSSVD